MLSGINNLPSHTNAHKILQPILREPPTGWSTYKKRLLMLCGVIQREHGASSTNDPDSTFDAALVIRALMEERNVEVVYALIFLATGDYEDNSPLADAIKNNPFEEWMTEIVREADSQARVGLTVDLLFLLTTQEERFERYFNCVISCLDPECPSASLLTREHRRKVVS